jgi:hypothetical protein
MRAAEFVERLEKVRRTGNSRWTARCPAHADRSPSLIVSEGDDGGTLIHCFAGCGIEAIVASVNLTISDIMPEHVNRGQQAYKPIRKPFPAADVIEMLATETMIVWLAACDMEQGKTLTDAERERLKLAAARIEVARG